MSACSVRATSAIAAIGPAMLATTITNMERQVESTFVSRRRETVFQQLLQQIYLHRHALAKLIYISKLLSDL
jgi:hypothetical protein